MRGYSINSASQVRSLGAPYLTGARAEAYGRLRGRLYKGNAALGVTIASYKQSADMIRKNAHIVREQAENIASLHSRYKLTKRLADKHLEVIFGWQPLVADMVAAAFTVIQGADLLEYVTGRGQRTFVEQTLDDRMPAQREYVTYNGTVRCTQAARVTIRNPNAWLAERAGLLNLASVAWDVVPFSFIVNMFVNTGSLINSITDFVGLSFDDPSITDVYTVTRDVHLQRFQPNVGLKTQRDITVYKRRYRQGPTLPMGLSFRLPKVEWGTAAMATSLMVQQAVPVVRLAKTLRRFKKLNYTE